MPRELDDITAEIIGAAVELHRRFGPGLLESVYEVLLERELVSRGLRVKRQQVLPFEFDGLHFEDGLRVDLIVEDSVVVELKSVEGLAPVHAKQVLTYLRGLDLQVGLVINFGEATLKEGIRRVVNNYKPSSSRLRVNQPKATD